MKSLVPSEPLVAKLLYFSGRLRPFRERLSVYGWRLVRLLLDTTRTPDESKMDPVSLESDLILWWFNRVSPVSRQTYQSGFS